MRKSIIWIMLLVLVVSVLLGGCKKKVTPIRKLKVGFISADEKTRATEVFGLRKKTYNGVYFGRQGKQPGFAVATYEQDGKFYRYEHEPLVWSADRDDIVILDPGIAAECMLWSIGDKLGKIQITAATEDGKNVDSATAYVVPDMMDSTPAPTAIICDEEMWMENPDYPGSGARLFYTDSRADIVFEKEVMRFPYGATKLDYDSGGRLRFNEIDWETPIPQEPTEYPYQISRWFLMHDQKGRKIAIHMSNSKAMPLYYIAWHAYENE